jgi:hypothetical protein
MTQTNVMSLDVWSLWTFTPMDVLSHRRYVSRRFSSRTFVCQTFCPSERFVPPDVLSLQKFCPRTLCLRTFCLRDILSGHHGHFFVVSATCITISCTFCPSGRFGLPDVLSLQTVYPWTLCLLTFFLGTVDTPL